MTTLGKYRHLLQSSTPAGHFAIVAVDHRANLQAALNQYAPSPITEAQFTDFKRQVMHHLLPEASAVLTDPTYGISAGIAEGSISGQKGLLAPLEETNYDVHPSQRMTRFIGNWSVEQIKRVGGTGVKLLLYYHPADGVAAEKHDLVSRVVDECRRWDIPFFLEPIAYSLDPQRSLTNAELRQVVVESVRVFCKLGVDVLKLEFPVDVKHEPDEAVWRAAVADVTAACTVPWALLSAGVSYDLFKRQTLVACQGGASGVIAGRAVWGEAVQLQAEARTQFLQTTGRERMRELATICAENASDWSAKVPAPVVSTAWYV